MAKSKNKEYFVVYLDDTDGDIKIDRMDVNEIKEFVRLGGDYQDDMAILEGNLIKGFDSVIDLNRL